ncbi:MAG: hypothetical protein WC315_07580 [Candidatus Omnitrophota bacterium]|jgi:hypothetical protein
MGHNAKNLELSVRRRKLAKVERLIAGKPIWKSEIYMKPEEYEEYIDNFLHSGDVDGEKAKIAVQMYDKKKKYEKPEVEAPIELDMEVLRKRGEETVESDEPAA